MGRILRIELRRSVAVGIGLLSLVVGAGLLLSFPEGFAGRWMQLAASARTMLMVLFPLALAGGALLGRRDARNRVDELFASTARPRWQRVLPTAGALAVTVVSAYTLMFLIGTAWVVPTAGYFPITAIVVAAIGALSLLSACWLGMAAGRAVPRLITAPVLAVVAVAVTGLLPDWLSTSGYGPGGVKAEPDPAALLLSPVFIGGLDDFQTVTARVNYTQALWLAALAVTGLLLLGAAGRRSIALATLPGVLGAAVAVPLMPAGGYDSAGVLDPKAVEWVCADGEPRVCVTRAHAGLLPGVVEPARRALEMLAAKLPDAPVRAVETQQVEVWALPGTGATAAPVRYPADTLVFPTPDMGPDGGLDDSGTYFLRSVLEATWDQNCVSTATFEKNPYLARQVALGWVIGGPLQRPGWVSGEEWQQVEHAYQSLLALPETEQRRRLMAAREAALDCRPDVVLSLLLPDVS